MTRNKIMDPWASKGQQQETGQLSSHKYSHLGDMDSFLIDQTTKAH